MHFHLPKPLHGWREFAGEVGIIVIGVLIALSAEQVVEIVHNHNVAAETQGAITAELNTDLSALAVRNSVEPCIDKRLNELRHLFADWERTGRFTTPQWVAQAPGTSVALSRYDAAQAAGRMALLPGEQQYRIGSVAAGLRDFAEIQADEGQVWGRLRALQEGPDALSSGDRTVLRIALQDASTLNYRAKLSIMQQLPQALEFGYRPDFTIFNRTEGQVLRGGVFRPSICTAIDTPRSRANKNQVVPLPF